VEEMSELAKRLEDLPRVAQVHVRRIGVLMALSDPEGATEAGQTAIAVFQELGDEAGEARVHREMGYVLWVNGDYVGALEANFRALRIHRELGNLQGEAGAAMNIAQVYRGMGDQENTLRWTEEAARFYRDLGRLRESLRCGRAARDMLRDDLEDPQAEAYVLTSLADSYSRLEHYPSALACLKRSLRLRRKMGDKAGEVRVLYALAKVYANLQDPGRAQDASEEAARKEEALAGATQEIALGAERRN
jgi:tetratricopeptide (TPR) repeat protein